MIKKMQVIRKAIFLIGFCQCCVLHLHATRYYFSALQGNDSRTSLEAQNVATPWQSITKLNAFFSQLSPGDSILFKSGEIFYGTVVINRSGTTGAPIIFSSYGGAEKPQITGYTTLSGWANAGVNIWETTLPGAQQNVASVLVNHSFKQAGRYPNAGTANEGYLTLESATGNTSITDLQLNGTPNWTGGEVVIRKVRWVLDRNIITQHQQNTISYQSQSGYGANAGYGYFIQNHPQTLDQDGEWYYRAGSRKFGIHNQGGNPAAGSVKVSTLQSLVTISNQANISFSNLIFSGSNTDAFDIHAAQNIRIANCEVLFAGHNAINALNTNYISVEATIINHTNNVACNLDNCNNVILKKNTITNTGANAGMGDGDSGGYEALLLSGHDQLIEGNIIDSTGYIAVTFRGNNVVVKNNVIKNFSYVKDDGSGIYTWNNPSNPPVYSGRIITGNIILNGLGAGAGTADPDKLYANGIYMDDNAGGVEISGNTVANCANYGFYIHNAHDLVIKNNTVYNNAVQLEMTQDDIAPFPIANVTLTGNTFVSKLVSQPVAEFKTNANNISSFGMFDNNYYSRPYYDYLQIGVLHKENGNYIWNGYDLETWKTIYGKDQNSKKSPFPIAPNDSIRFVYNAETVNKSIALDNDYADIANNSYTGSINLAPFSSAVLLKKNLPQPPEITLCPATGSILREQWNNIAGNNVSDIPVQTAATNTSPLTIFESPTNIGDNYGARIRGYICPPQTGNYTFWIASDDASELWLSTDNNPVNKTRIAYLLSWTASREWNKYASQKSASIYLQAGRQYYVEALHKEGGGGDNLAVGWQLPSGSMEMPIPGNRLSPFVSTQTNQTIDFPPIASKTFGDAPFTINATASSGLPVSFSIVSGPATIAGNTVTLTGPGSVVITASQPGNTLFNVASPVTQTVVVNPGVTVNCSATGSILREQWNNIAGNDVSNIPVQTAASNTGQVTIFESPVNIGDSYGARIRGYICPPQTGNYTFWIASDDASELWLSTDNNPANKARIAYLLGWTGSREWNKYASQKSASIYLQAGQQYYVEALHKEGVGDDNLAVGWQLPNGNTEMPIPGNRLSPFVSTQTNQTIDFPPIGSKTFGDAPFTINATASSGLPVSFSIVSGPANIAGNVVTLTGPGNIVITASQPGNTLFNAASLVTQTVVVNPVATTNCSATGSILREQWNNIAGNNVSDIPVQTAATNTSPLTIFESPTNIGDNYGARIRGYICPPQTGNYTFWIASDDASELWLSTDNNPVNKTRIAYLLSWTSSREWNKYASQKSASIYLQAGRQYYVEALHKEGGGGDNLAVGWQLPNGSMEMPIPGNRLSPFVSTQTNQTIDFPSIASKTFGDAPFVINATASSGLPVSFSIVSGPATIAGNTVTLTGPGSVVITASQSGNTLFNAASPVTQTVVVNPGVTVNCSATGSILREQWDNISGYSISSIPVQTVPNRSMQLISFESPVDYADNYGARIRGYICPPQTGNYIFWIAADDVAELWLSATDAEGGKRKIANVPDWTSSREWNKYASQKSVNIYLQAGQRYYIEALQKEGAGGDNLAVAWQLPNGSMEMPIPGNRLSPFNAASTNASYAEFNITDNSIMENIMENSVRQSQPALSVYPNPFSTTSTVEINTQENGLIKLELFNEQGIKVKSLFNGLPGKTSRRVTLNSEGLKSGLYIVRLTTQIKVLSHKIIVLK